MHPASPPATPAAERILDVAERLIQIRGFNGFSYADVAAELGVTKASLHYHFPSKADLGRRVVERYHRRFEAALLRIAGDAAGGPGRLARYAGLYADVLRRGRLCLCGMLASDQATLPREVRERVNGFFDANEAWLARVLEEGRAARTLRFDGAQRDEARALVAALEGAMLLAHARGDASRFDAVASRLVAQLTPRRRPEPPRRRR